MLKMIMLAASLTGFVAATSVACDCGKKTAPTSGIKGEALRRPLQGIVPVDPPKALPVAGVEIIVKDAKTGKEVARTKTAKDGTYNLTLPAGQYKLEAKYGRDWVYTATVNVGANQWVTLQSYFRYTGKHFPPSAGPRNPASAATAKTSEIDVEGKLPQTLTMSVGDVVDFTKVFPGSLKMVYTESSDESVLEQKWVPLTTPQTPLPTKVVVGRFEAKKAGTAKVIITFEDNGGKQTTKEIAVTVK